MMKLENQSLKGVLIWKSIYKCLHRNSFELYLITEIKLQILNTEHNLELTLEVNFELARALILELLHIKIFSYPYKNFF